MFRQCSQTNQAASQASAVDHTWTATVGIDMNWSRARIHWPTAIMTAVITRSRSDFVVIDGWPPQVMRVSWAEAGSVATMKRGDAAADAA